MRLSDNLILRFTIALASTVPVAQPLLGEQAAVLATLPAPSPDVTVHFSDGTSIKLARIAFSGYIGREMNQIPTDDNSVAPTNDQFHRAYSDQLESSLLFLQDQKTKLFRAVDISKLRQFDNTSIGTVVLDDGNTVRGLFHGVIPWSAARYSVAGFRILADQRRPFAKDLSSISKLTTDTKACQVTDDDGKTIDVDSCYFMVDKTRGWKMPEKGLDLLEGAFSATIENERLSIKVRDIRSIRYIPPTSVYEWNSSNDCKVLLTLRSGTEVHASVPKKTIASALFGYSRSGGIAYFPVFYQFADFELPIQRVKSVEFANEPGSLQETADTNPVAVHQGEIPLPGTTGPGVLDFGYVVEADGSVSNVRILKGVNPQIDTLVLRTINTWKFKPATKAGRPVAVRLQGRRAVGN